MATFGVVFLVFLSTRTDFSRATTIVALLYAAVLIPAPHLIGTARNNQIIAFVALLLLGAITPFLPASLPAQHHTSAVIKTEYYNLGVKTYSDIFPKSSIAGGGLARIGDSYLRLSGNGHLYVFGWQPKTDHFSVTLLPYRAPINGDDFAAAAGRPWEIAQPETIQENQKSVSTDQGLHTEWFRTYGLLTQEIGSRIRIFVSHDYWKADQDCWVERVSMLDADRATILRGGSGPQWSTLYETSPCLPIHGEGRRRGVSFVGYFGGGRMALLGPETLLLTVGDFGFDGVASLSVPSQDPAASYGKTIAINIADRDATGSLRWAIEIRRVCMLTVLEPSGQPNTGRKVATNSINWRPGATTAGLLQHTEPTMAHSHGHSPRPRVRNTTGRRFLHGSPRLASLV